MTKAKPFIKWVGGKSQLIEQLDALLPADFGNWENADKKYLKIEVFRGLEISDYEKEEIYTNATSN